MLDKLQQRILMNLDSGSYASLVSRKINMTNGYVLTNIKQMAQMGLVTRDLTKREKRITLTDKGNQIKEHLFRINTILGRQKI